VLAAATSRDAVMAMAGIASPAHFFAALRSAGWNVVGEAPFRDHHRYASGELDAVFARARAAGAARVVTTEKDFVRLLPFRPWALPIDAVPMRIEMDDRGACVEWLLSVVRSARA
jgi:tetraacyldisaccharide 4'-kinase